VGHGLLLTRRCAEVAKKAVLHTRLSRSVGKTVRSPSLVLVHMQLGPCKAGPRCSPVSLDHHVLYRPPKAAASC
jgi:hypothetical protein